MTDAAALTGQVALVTGGAGGIGRAICHELSEAGAGVVVADLDGQGADRVAAELRQKSVEAFGVAVDVSKADDVEGMYAAVLERTGSLHVLVHCAGIGIERPFLQTEDEEWRRVIGINLCGSFFCLRAAGRIMAEAGYGRIVTISSVAGMRAGTGRAAYGASKAGIIMLSQVLAVELATSGVTVNTIAPGAIETELVRKMHSPETRTNYRRSIPMDRYGEPEEVAAAALFFCSPESRYVTGHVLTVDGGFSAAGVLSGR